MKFAAPESPARSTRSATTTPSRIVTRSATKQDPSLAPGDHVFDELEHLIKTPKKTKTPSKSNETRPNDTPESSEKHDGSAHANKASNAAKSFKTALFNDMAPPKNDKGIETETPKAAAKENDEPKLTDELELEHDKDAGEASQDRGKVPMTAVQATGKTKTIRAMLGYAILAIFAKFSSKTDTNSKDAQDATSQTKEMGANKDSDTPKGKVAAATKLAVQAAEKEAAEHANPLVSAFMLMYAAVFVAVLLSFWIPNDGVPPADDPVENRDKWASFDEIWNHALDWMGGRAAWLAKAFAGDAWLG